MIGAIAGAFYGGAPEDITEKALEIPDPDLGM